MRELRDTTKSKFEEMRIKARDAVKTVTTS